MSKVTKSLKDYILETDRDPVSWEFYKRQEACDWSAEEFRFTKDRDDYLESPKRIQDLLKDIFGFFLIGDGLISEDLVVLIQEAIDEKNCPKVMYISMQLKMENTHAETYSKAALTIVPESEHDEMIEMCDKLECVRKKGDWITNFIDSHESKALRNVGCACGDGIFFVGLFSIIFYFKKLNKFKDFIESNEQISKDESIHRDEKASEAQRSLVPEEFERAKEIIMSAVELEKENNVDAGIAIHPDVKISDIEKYLSKVQQVIVMTVLPGFGGQKFMNNQVYKIKELFNIRKKNNLNYKISVDGGISNITAKECINNGVDILAVGSYLLNQDENEYPNLLSNLK